MSRGYADETKGNPYFQARDRTGMSRYAAAESLGVCVDTLISYETGYARVPHDIMLNMTDIYRAPELQTYYCSHECPVKRPKIDYKQGFEIAVQFENRLKRASGAIERFKHAIDDGRLSESDKNNLRPDMPDVQELAKLCEEYLLYCKKNGVEE